MPITILHIATKPDTFNFQLARLYYGRSLVELFAIQMELSRCERRASVINRCSYHDNDVHSNIFFFFYGTNKITDYWIIAGLQSNRAPTHLKNVHHDFILYRVAGTRNA